MYNVVGQRIYCADKSAEDELFHLIKFESENGTLTLSVLDEGISQMPAEFRRCTSEALLIKFGKSYKPKSLITVPETTTIYLDEASKEITIAPESPSAGAWGAITGIDKEIATATVTGNVFTVVPVALGSTTFKCTWTPTSSNYATSEITISVAVVKRQLILSPLRDMQILKSGGTGAEHTVEVPITANTASVTVEAYSADSALLAVSVSGQTITLAPSTSSGKTSVRVIGSKASWLDSDYITLNVQICDSAVTIDAPTDVEVAPDEEVTITWTLTSGAEIIEYASSDPTKVEVVSATADSVKVKGISDTANVTVTSQKRDLGQAVDTVAVTVVEV